VQKYIEYVALKHKEFGPNKRKENNESFAWHMYKDQHNQMWELRKAMVRVYKKDSIPKMIETITTGIDQYQQQLSPDVSNDAILSMQVARMYLDKPTGTETEEVDDTQGAAAQLQKKAGASKSMPAPVPQQTQPQGAAAGATRRASKSVPGGTHFFSPLRAEKNLRYSFRKP
jgi:hypothetical protein